MNRTDLGVWLSIISHGRPERVDYMRGQVGEATWYVEPEDAERYHAQGATVHVQQGLCHARNVALEDAIAHGLPCLQLSDDLSRLMIGLGDGKSGPVTIDKVVRYLLAVHTLKPESIKLIGIAPTNNAFFYNPSKSISMRAFCVGDFSLVFPCELRWDEGLPVKEDYDYTLQHIARYGRATRCNAILATFAHRVKRGGCYEMRAQGAEQFAIRRLILKWPGLIKLNPKRENEILLTLPK